MLRKFTSILALAALLAACDRNDVCNTENPLEELGWLKALAAENEKNANDGIGYYIYQGRYDRKDVFINDVCCPACMVVIRVYNCNGDVLEQVSADKVTDRVLIWQSEKSGCPKR